MSRDLRAEALKLLVQAKTSRARHIEHIRSYVDTTQYGGRSSWWEDSDKPLFERAPCIALPIVEEAIDSHVDLALGEGRFPVASTDDEALDEALGKVAEMARLSDVAAQVLAESLSVGSSASLCGIRAGRPFVDTVRAEWCVPTLDREGAVTKLVVEYPYLDEIRVGGEVRTRAMLYRRVVDAVSDTTYHPAELAEGEPKWTVAEQVAHGLGFCPVVWYPHGKRSSIVNEIDGRAIHAKVLDEIEGLDFALSMKHRAALYAGDPQWTEVGVEEGHNPSGGNGRAARVVHPSSPLGGATGPGNPKHLGGYTVPRGPGRVRKKGVGQVWQYESPDVKVELHTLPGDALKALDEHAKDLAQKVAMAMGVVFLDPATMPSSSTMSGRFVESFRRPQFARVDRIRADFGAVGLVPLWSMLLRICLAKGLLPGAKAPGWVSWHCPPIELSWGPYRQPEPEERLAEISTAKTAKEAGLATRRVAVEMVRHILGVKDVEAYLRELEAEADKNREAAGLPKPGEKPKADDDGADDESDDDDDGDEEPDA